MTAVGFIGGVEQSCPVAITGGVVIGFTDNESFGRAGHFVRFGDVPDSITVDMAEQLGLTATAAGEILGIRPGVTAAVGLSFKVGWISQIMGIILNAVNCP